MINRYNFNAEYLKIRARHRFMKVKDNLNYEEFLTEVGIVQMGIFLNQMEFEATYKLCFTISFFPATLHFSSNIL